MTFRMFDAGVSVYREGGTVVTISGAKVACVLGVRGGGVGGAAAAVATAGAETDAAGAAVDEGAATVADLRAAQPSFPKN